VKISAIMLFRNAVEARVCAPSIAQRPTLASCNTPFIWNKRSRFNAYKVILMTHGK
jgi:hypothetical protein